LVDFLHNRVEFCLNFLLLGFVLLCACIRVAFKELKAFLRCILDGSLVSFFELVLKLLIIKSVLDLEAVVLKTILGIDLLTELIVLVLVLFGILDHLLNLFFGETSLVIGDCDLL